MIKSKHVLLPTLLCLMALAATGAAEVSLKEAVKIGRKNIDRLAEQSHQYKVEYDTIIALPVHSRTIYRSDFYLLYFLKGPSFKAEVEVEKKSGEATLLAVGKMVQPYHQRPDDQFHYKYFNVDSVLSQGFFRARLKQDSARLVYFGVTPMLGKRGVIWELFSSEGVSYISLAGPAFRRDQILSDLNTQQRAPGNWAADSIRLVELVGDIKRLDSLSEANLPLVKLTRAQADSIKGTEMLEMEQIYARFPDLRKAVFLQNKATDSGQTKP